MSKKNLSILIYSLAGGGAERVVSILLNELQDKYDITLVLMRNKIDYDIPKSIKVLFLEDSNPVESGVKKLLKLPLLGLKYKKFCKDNNIDISLTFMNRPSYVAIFSKIFGNRVYNIISERSTPSMMYRDDNILSKISKILIKKLYPKADLIIANAEGNRIDLIDNFGIAESKVITIPNLFDLEKIEKNSNEFVTNINFNRFTFITVGRLDEGKNHKLMINAFSKLEDVSTQLIILGEGINREALERQIIELKLMKRVFLVGFDNNPYKYFSKSDIFLFTSRYEGFPNVLVEALACGLPVISTDCKSGPREILAPSLDVYFQLQKGIELVEYGVLTPVDREEDFLESMNLLCKNKIIRDKYRNRAKDRAKSFDKESIVNHFIEKIEGK
jgi:N-acetylgalactosamine-N,N'-diacetylbacillosaminyl-diphospho-undecaprenol 4-alpha-N-acetylgalactosaminyltransferase